MYKQSSEQKPNYMAALDAWLDENVIEPLAAAFEQYAEDADAGLSQDEAMAKVEPVVEVVKKAVREKVLESYRNGQAAKTSDRGERRPYGKR